MEVIFTPLAERHIDKLHEYITEHDGEDRADGYIGRIVAYCNGFTTLPQRGTRRDDLLPGLRVVGFERRVTIAFVITENAVLTRRNILRRAGFRDRFPKLKIFKPPRCLEWVAVAYQGGRRPAPFH